MKSIPNWLRWVLVLPAAIVSYFAIQIVIAIMNSFTPFPESFENIFCQLINSVAGPYCFVVAGTMLAPKYNFIVSITLTVLYVIINTTILVIAIMNGSSTIPLWWLIITSILGIITTIYACARFHKEESHDLLHELP
jgi:hypothetical protein